MSTTSMTGIELRRDGHPATVAGLIEAAARRWGERTAWNFVNEGAKLSFSDLDRRSTAIANHLKRLGVGAGDRVAVMLPNVPEFPLTWLALAKLGATMVPVNGKARQFDALHVIDHSGAVAAVTSEAFLPVLRAVRAEAALFQHLIVIDDCDDSDVLRLDESDEQKLNLPVYPESLLNIQYTSGTTGRPKGCMLSQHYWVTLAVALTAEFPYCNSDDVLLTAQPFSYIDPQWNVMLTLLTGASLVITDGFHPRTFWQTIREQGVTWFCCVGLMPNALLKMPPSDEDRNHSVRAILCSAIPADLHETLEERWGVPWYEAFGMTESGADIGVADFDHDELVCSGSIGFPHGHREVRIIGDDGTVLPRGEVGELIMRGPGLMDGYFRDPVATAEVFKDGWFHTGDKARMDEAGRVYHSGRKKDMIRRSGENIAAAEVEEALRLHPAVRTCAVIGVADEMRGEEVKAFIVLEPGTEVVPSAEELAAFCSEQIAYFKVPRYWAFRDRLPLTPSERVSKGELRADDGPWTDARPTGRFVR